MRTYTVIITPRAIDPIGQAFPPTGSARLDASDQVYRLHSSDRGPLHDEDKARVARDVAERAALAGSTPTGQPS